MTLDFKRLLKNSIMKQMSIQHVDIPERNVQVFKREELMNCMKCADKIKSIYGENSMLEGDYWIFLSNAGTQYSFDREFTQKTLFKVFNAGLGNAANNMVETDIKVFSFDGEGDAVPPADNSIDDVELTGNEPDDANSDAVADVMDGGDSELDESVEEPGSGEKFAFLKITMK